MVGGLPHPDHNPDKEVYIYARYPDWDGDVEHLVDFMNSREGNLYEVYYRNDTNEWFWLDYYFNFGTSNKDKEKAILEGAAASCYWATDYEEYERREYEKSLVESPQETPCPNF